MRADWSSLLVVIDQMYNPNIRALDLLWREGGDRHRRGYHRDMGRRRDGGGWLINEGDVKKGGVGEDCWKGWGGKKMHGYIICERWLGIVMLYSFKQCINIWGNLVRAYLWEMNDILLDTIYGICK